MLRRWNVTWKFLAPLAVPILALAVFASYLSANTFQDRVQASQTSKLLSVLEQQDTAGREVTIERGYTILLAATSQKLAVAPPEQKPAYQSVVDQLTTQLAQQYPKTDGHLDGVRKAYGRLDVSALDPAVQDAIDEVLTTPELIKQIRAQVKAGELDMTELVKEYQVAVDRALAVTEALQDTTPYRELSPYLDAYLAMDRLLAQIALESPVGTLVLQGAAMGQIPAAQLFDAAKVFSAGQVLANEATQAVEELGIPEQLQISADYEAVRNSLQNAQPSEVATGTPDKWSFIAGRALASATDVRDAVRAATVDYADLKASDASTVAWRNIGIVLGVVLLSLALAVVFSFSVSRPLRRLTHATQRVRDEIPALVEHVALSHGDQTASLTRIEVDGTDEIGRLAAAFNDVNEATLELARQQAKLRNSIADIFVNVARRDQLLLNRQLAFLDELERHEQDPNVLSNLFRMDHLAARMRRNAESLLVLAGIDSGRRSRQPMALSDVVRTASSEIEFFDRVTVNLAVDPLILGQHALNTAHLLAEILENATIFSDAHLPVEVTSTYEGQFVRVSVRDRGMGMSADEFNAATHKVTSRSAMDVVGAQNLGLYVVGRLADRLDARVAFAPGRDGGGTEVIIDLPLTLCAADSHTSLLANTEQFELETVAQQPTHVMPSVEVHPESPEVPVVAPVDLDSLTDGTTTSGMPRRRSRSVEPTIAAPSATVPQTGAIVLPPIAAPQIPLDLPQEESWTPPEDITIPGAALPSRQRHVDTSVAPSEPLLSTRVTEETDATTEIPAVDVGARASLFSRFRTMGDLDASLGEPENPVELPPAPSVSATDIAMAEALDSTQTEWTPTFELQEEPPAGHVVADAEDSLASLLGEVSTGERGSEPPLQAAPVASDDWLSVLTDETVVMPSSIEAVGDSGDDLASSTDQPGHEPATWTTAQDAPFAAAGPAPSTDDAPYAAETSTEDIPEDLRVDSLPDFDEIMSDLPSRRSTREAHPTRRSLFGRRTRGEQEDFVSSDELDERAASEWHHQTNGNGDHSASVPRHHIDGGSSDSHRHVEEPEMGQDWEAPVFAPEPALAPATRSYASPRPVSVPQSPDTPTAPVPVYQHHGPAAARTPVYDALDSRGTGASSEDQTHFGPPTPLTRRTKPTTTDSLYGDDSVEARSEWTATAVLYEEMSSLLRSSGSSSLADSASDNYQPVRMEPGSSTLSRRPMENREGYVDRFTARIERDPEQLRARLAAFQSATARGRVEAQEEADAYQRSGNVPDQAPQSR